MVYFVLQVFISVFTASGIPVLMLELRGFILQGDNPFWKAVTHVAESDLLHVGAAGLWEGQCLLHIGRNPSLISL